MTIDIHLVENDEDLLTLIPLKSANYTEFTNKICTKYDSLQKILNLKKRGSDFWIANKDRVAIGYAIGVLKNESYNSQGVYVTPKNDCRKKGVGTSLKQAQIDFAINLGCHNIWSKVTKDNLASIAVQKKVGCEFTPFENMFYVDLDLTTKQP